ncbi:metal-dependent transcriptional regulator [uncultured Gulosibacter sp.]|uniref:metal-dependent transcriptional regulator n=1 Tax=uncultured Gulosibacter sp. TaxID=1339167 RepID=UPI002889191C|nr:metal-dependent transcriptional regulator [uncultured Gulosibacter sp.]
MAQLVDTTEMYLRTILDLEEEGIVPLRARISERLGHSGPTVSQTIARMERDGLVRVASDRRLELTDQGRTIAVRVLRKHRIAEGLLANVIGLDMSMVHDEACRWEHVMSDEAERRIYELLGRPKESPYGTPIPGLEEFDAPASELFLDGVVPLDQTPLDGETVLQIRRIGEPVQANTADLEVLVTEGICPGSQVIARKLENDFIEVAVCGTDRAICIHNQTAGHVYVAGDVTNL